jgi:hypothetical protein
MKEPRERELDQPLFLARDFDKGMGCQYCTAVQKTGDAVPCPSQSLRGGTTKQSCRVSGIEIASQRSQ